MPADTANKRYSAMMMGLPWRGKLPIPDGTVSQGDRQHVLGYYSGILFGGGMVLTQPLVITRAPARHQAVESTVDILIFTAPARHQAVISAARGGG